MRSLRSWQVVVMAVQAIITGLRRPTEEDLKFKVSVGYVSKAVEKIQTQE